MGNIGFLASYNGRWFDGGYAKSGYEKQNREKDIEIIIEKLQIIYCRKLLI